MQVKSDKYTNGEFKPVKDLVNLDENLLISSQMANSLLMMAQQEKLFKEAQAKMKKETESSAAAPPEEPSKRDESKGDDAKPQSEDAPADDLAASVAEKVDDENAALADRKSVV